MLSHLMVLGCAAPLGVDRNPEFSYRVKGTQRARRIRVTSGETVFWDTGRVETASSVRIPYEGQTLPEATVFRWSVTVWTEDGEESGESFFSTGLTHWKGQWICDSGNPFFPGNDKSLHPQASYLRRTFSLKEKPVDAMLYICGLGYFKAFINGEAVNTSQLDPVFTAYDQTVLYRTLRVNNLQAGCNVLGVILGNGFYNAEASDAWNFRNAVWRDVPKLLLQMEITFADGQHTTVVSDDGFSWAEGPIVSNTLRSGETYDASKELGDWLLPEYSQQGAWHPVLIARDPGGVRRSQFHQPIAATLEWPPQITERGEDFILADAGRNTVGWAVLTLDAEPGATVTVEYGEQPFTKEKANREKIDCYVFDAPFQTDTYLSRGGKAVWHPLFCYHGFRYLRIRTTGKVNSLSVSIEEIRTAVGRIGSFRCSLDRINRLQRAAVRSAETNFHGFLTDCPHREKNPWTGDALASAEQVLYNLDAEAVLSRWMDSFPDAMRPSGQLPGIVPSSGWGYNWGSGPAWDSAMILIPWYLYLYRGDRSTAERLYPYMLRYLRYCAGFEKDGTVCFGLGDWCPPKEAPACGTAVTDTYFYWLDTLTVARLARLLGKEEAEQLERKAEEIRQSWQKHFPGENSDSMTALACAVQTETPEGRGAALEKLIAATEKAEGKTLFGILGAKAVLHTLVENGRADLVLPFLTSDGYPSWGYMDSRGATTLWETWDGNASQNHHMYSDYSSVLYQMAGILPAAPGFQKIRFAPQFPQALQWAEASHECPYGEIRCRWERKDGAILLELTVPGNTEASLCLPEGFQTGASENLKPGKHQINVKIEREGS